MAKLVKTTILIDGKEVKQFYKFSLSQGIFAHHVFSLVCPTEALDGTNAPLFSKSKNFIGTTFKVKIEGFEKGSQPLLFSGMVTQVEASRFSGHTGNVVVSGFSPTILMDNGPHCNSWEKKALKNIASDVFGHFPANLLSPQIQPVYGETMAYTVQYKETAWQFLNRLSATYGEWFYYNGENMILGTPKPKTAKLVYGSNLTNFSMALQLRPGNFQQVSYDYVNNAVYSATPNSIEQKAGLNELGKHVFGKSKEFFSASPKMFNNTFLTNQKQLEDFANTRAAAQSSNMIRFNGTSSHFGVQLGNTVKISDNFGEYTIIDVSHHCDGQGNYSNDFIAIPSTIKVPPVTNYTEPVCEAQSAIVTDNHDVKGLGRIRVKFHWMKASKKTPWLRLTSPHGGGNKGMHFIPEIGEEVIVGFEGNSPVKPYIIGTVYHGKANNSYSNAGNDVKALQTRSGTKIIMNDAKKSILIEDPSGNSMLMDGDGNIKVVANKTIVLLTGDSKVEMNKDGTINMEGKKTIVLTSGESKIEMKKDGTIDITGKKITVNAKEKAVMVSKQASFTADGNGAEAKMEGVKAKVNGSAEVKVAGGAKTEVSASGNVAVKGALITLN
jgi:type VI secretion system secreted protein VgrG